MFDCLHLSYVSIVLICQSFSVINLALVTFRWSEGHNKSQGSYQEDLNYALMQTHLGAKDQMLQSNICRNPGADAVSWQQSNICRLWCSQISFWSQLWHQYSHLAANSSNLIFVRLWCSQTNLRTNIVVQHEILRRLSSETKKLSSSNRYILLIIESRTESVLLIKRIPSNYYFAIQIWYHEIDLIRRVKKNNKKINMCWLMICDIQLHKNCCMIKNTVSLDS